MHRLEENHGLLTHMAEKENGSEASTALPKLLLELVSQVDEGEAAKEGEVAKEGEALDDEMSTLEKSTKDLGLYFKFKTYIYPLINGVKHNRINIRKLLPYFIA